MDSNIEKSCELDNVVVIYYGQDCDLFDKDCDFDNLLNEYLDTSSEFCLRMLLANLIEILNQADRAKVMLERYKGEFDPNRWDLSADEWLDKVYRRLIAYMKSKIYSTILSKF